MPLSRADKEEIRTRVLLELNAAFVNIARHFGGDKDQESYITLIEKKVKQIVSEGDGDYRPSDDD